MSTLNFKTPIRQVASSIYENTPTKNLDTFNHCPSLIAIRTISGTTFVKIIIPETGIDPHNVSSHVHLKAIVLDSILHQKDDIFNHMHVTFNPMIYGEAAIIDGNGSIHLWKGERHEDHSKLFIKYDFTTMRTSQVDAGLSFKDLWKTCVYGAHPQTLLVASRTSADLLDFRVFFLYSKVYRWSLSYLS
ncbi:hypothetical protein C1645_96408 [Glomus cerebriforme]|uniref:RRN6 beta-propeller domain-containing protein n=1 Tax=Glomus cerebriforme TaxID=658196 RepID=A0A397TMD0_9GLOM|nr:hypothetical protein C1645_96408 [Glomus cerebriforme]